MAKATPIACTPDNCGDLFRLCGKKSTYVHRKCRCDKCKAAATEYKRKRAEARQERFRENDQRGPCTPENCGDVFTKCGRPATYNNGCRCDVCKEAAYARNLAYNDANRDEVLARKRAYHAANAEAEREYNRRWREENSEAYRERQRAKYAADPEKHRAIAREWRAANPESVRNAWRRWADNNESYLREYRRRHYAENREEIRQRARTEEARAIARMRQREWRRRNPQADAQKQQRHRARRASVTSIPFTTEQWEQKMAYWGNRCYLNIPGICNGKPETIEHVKPIDAGGAHMLANLRPACHRCNCSKSGNWPYAVTYSPS